MSIAQDIYKGIQKTAKGIKSYSEKRETEAEARRVKDLARLKQENQMLTQRVGIARKQSNLRKYQGNQGGGLFGGGLNLGFGPTVDILGNPIKPAKKAPGVRHKKAKASKYVIIKGKAYKRA